MSMMRRSPEMGFDPAIIVFSLLHSLMIPYDTSIVPGTMELETGGRDGVFVCSLTADGLR